MKLAYFDCFSGISGDMFIGSLLDAGLDFRKFSSELESLGLPGHEIASAKVLKRHISATQFTVVSKDNRHFRHLKDLNGIVEQTDLDAGSKETARQAFLTIATAEAKVHDQPLQQVHFHEIGAVDTVVDVLGAIIGLKLLGIDKVFCSKLNVGTGFIDSAHGRFPVPAPATAEILTGLPVYATDSQAELVTPTGAALIKILAAGFGELPAMRIENIGYGAGSADLSQPNVLRVVIGQTVSDGGFESDTVAVLETNIDDMNPQLYEYLREKLQNHGALEVYLTNVAMKKNRPGILLSVISRPDDLDSLARIILTETTSIGLRIREERRRKLPRTIEERDTRFGKVRFKITKLAGEVLDVVPEYEDCKRIAREKKLPLRQVYQELAAISR